MTWRTKHYMQVTLEAGIKHLLSYGLMIINRDSCDKIDDSAIPLSQMIYKGIDWWLKDFYVKIPKRIKSNVAIYVCELLIKVEICRRFESENAKCQVKKESLFPTYKCLCTSCESQGSMQAAEFLFQSCPLTEPPWGPGALWRGKNDNASAQQPFNVHTGEKKMEFLLINKKSKYNSEDHPQISQLIC